MGRAEGVQIPFRSSQATLGKDAGEWLAGPFPGGVSKVSWFWINMPLGAVFFAAVAGIPLWLVFRHPDARPAPVAAVDATPQSRPVIVLAPAAGHGRRGLAGASS
jgi:hypothetical protein